MIFRINNHLVGAIGTRGKAGQGEQVIELPQPEYLRGPIGYLCVANDGNYWLVESQYDVLAIAAVLPINVLRFSVKSAASHNQAEVIPLHRPGRPMAV